MKSEVLCIVEAPICTGVKADAWIARRDAERIAKTDRMVTVAIGSGNESVFVFLGNMENERNVALRCAVVDNPLVRQRTARPLARNGTAC